MKKYKKYWFYLLLALSTSLTVIVINNINDTVIPKIIQDINSGVIGSILTTIITLLLLSNQTESQENLTKTSVIYEEKLKIFNNFLKTMSDCLEDGNLTTQKTKKIIQSFSELRIHVSYVNATKLEQAISSIDNSFFYFDEYSTPNLSKLTKLYTEITNVFRHELYVDKLAVEFKTFDFQNLNKVLFRNRLSIIKPKSFIALLDELKNNTKILHKSNKSGKTIVYEINSELIFALKELNNFMLEIVNTVSKEITFSYEINRQIVNNETYSGIPFIKLYYKNVYFAFYGVSETKILWIGRNIPKQKQVASFEIFELEKFQNFRQQIIEEFQKLLSDINKNI